MIVRGHMIEPGADLTGANLPGANLRWADLRGADLTGADLREANLRGANLRWADLYGANLYGANLPGANLSGANLREANLYRADLRGTCLDPQAPVPVLTDEAARAAGLEPDGDRVWGWRTARSTHCGDEHYTPHREPYVAPWFSVDAETECHPGRYLAGLEQLRAFSGRGHRAVRCWCLRSELVIAGGKCRCKRLWITAQGEAL